ncbi:DNA primase [Desulfotomaculum arcticum]|uniref:DNA primase n=1 Tax=Desulfotruncus arcticus DSM 17038 TaxID=1121424 RepID=A0A1I2Z6B0_9FIRM|nr:CHC2 zinc finger domain-containing protein [Desulfotruncus arcticus]SFH33393.1 DNA primase [Desulfotomaculum arcticum] [Desulfotruncus arcticus DSM 17038]
MRAANVTQQINVFQLVKQLSIVEVINRYSIVELKQRGRRWTARCPLHNDHSPSFVVFPNGKWKCFGCGEHGDGVDLVAKIFNLELIEAARMIARDFNIEAKKPLSPAARRKIIQQAKKREKERILREKLDKAHETLSLLVRTINKSLAAGGYKSHCDLAGLLHKVDYYEYLIECLLSNNAEIQIMALNSFNRDFSLGGRFTNESNP